MSKAEAIQKFSELIEHVSPSSLPHILKVVEQEATKETGIDQELIKRMMEEDRGLLSRLAK